jgi:Ca2+-transporting ATPase
MRRVALQPEEGHEALQGPDFRKMTDDQIDAILPRLRILARSSPTDKFKLVSALQRLREVVAVTGNSHLKGRGRAIAVYSAPLTLMHLFV